MVCRTRKWVVAFIIVSTLLHGLTLFMLYGAYEQITLHIGIIDILLNFVEQLWEMRHDHFLDEFMQGGVDVFTQRC